MKALFVIAAVFFISYNSNATDLEFQLSNCKFIAFESNNTYYLYENDSAIPVEIGALKNLPFRHGTVCDIANNKCAVTRDGKVSVELVQEGVYLFCKGELQALPEEEDVYGKRIDNVH